MAGKEMTADQIAQVMIATDLVISEWPVFKEKILQNEQAIKEEARQRENEDKEMKYNYLGRFEKAEKQREKISEKIDVHFNRLSNRLWGIIMILAGLLITSGGGVIISWIAGK